MPATTPALRDRCPKCCGLPAVTPHEYQADDDHVRCEYRCPNADCGHEWVARWALGVLGSGLGGAA